MNKKTLLILVLVPGIAAIGIMYLLINTGRPVQTNRPASPQLASSPLASPTKAVSGAYTDYRENIIATTSGEKILFFHAPWCPQCRSLEHSIKAGTIPANLTIIKVDYDSNQALRQKYGVTIQTTLVKVDDAGKLIKKYVAYDSPTLDTLIKSAL